MRKINRLAVCLMCVSILLCACGKDAVKEVDTIENGTTQKVPQSEDAQSVSEDKKEDASVDGSEAEEPECVYNNGGNFIKVDD